MNSIAATQSSKYTMLFCVNVLFFIIKYDFSASWRDHIPDYVCRL